MCRAQSGHRVGSRVHRGQADVLKTRKVRGKGREHVGWVQPGRAGLSAGPSWSSCSFLSQGEAQKNIGQFGCGLSQPFRGSRGRRSSLWRLVTAVSMQAGVNLCPLCANLLPWEGGVSNQLWEGPGEVPFAWQPAIFNPPLCVLQLLSLRSIKILFTAFQVALASTYTVGLCQFHQPVSVCSVILSVDTFGRVNWLWFTCLSLQTLIWKLGNAPAWSTCYNWFCCLMHFLSTLGRHAIREIKEQILHQYLPCEAPDWCEWINRWGETSFLSWLFSSGGGGQFHCVLLW